MRRRGLLPLLAASVLACAGGRPAPAPPVLAQTQAAAPAPAEQGPRRRSQLVRGALAQNVRVVVAQNGEPLRSASGVVVGVARTPAGAVSYVVTNAHVVQARENEKPGFLVLVDLPTGDTQEFAARVAALGTVPEEDLAVLAVVGPALEAAPLAADEELAVGEEVFVVAAPYGRSLSVSGGLISQITYEEKAPRRPTLLKTDAAIGYGASGGGLFSGESGKLLGIVEGYRTAKVSFPVAKETYSFDVPMPGETFASPAGKLRRFLGRHGLGELVGGAVSVSAR